MLNFTKTFIRKINVGRDTYTIEQNGATQTITILRKKTNTFIYTYNANDNTCEYDPQDLQLIKLLFQEAHIERYLI
jgi:hypothetical protein